MSSNTIAYQGYAGAYSHLSCTKVYPDMKPFACNSFAQAMLMVEKGEAKLAMIPIENSTAGRVEEIYRLMPKMKLHIIEEHFEPVNHCLLGIKGTEIGQLKTIASHPQALAQCNHSIEALNLTQIAHFDTAGSAEELAITQNATHAAIASELAAKLYNLDILQQNFQDITGNTTRFIILSREKSTPKLEQNIQFISTYIFSVRNIPSVLYKSLGGFATNGINMVKLESYMPFNSMSATSFHLDVEGHPDQKSMKLAIQELDFFSTDLRLIGTYKSHSYRNSNT